VNRAKTQLKAALLFSVDSTMLCSILLLAPLICWIFVVALQVLNDEIGRQMLTLGRRMPAVELDARISVSTPVLLLLHPL
jgi:hypothetical protein